MSNYVKQTFGKIEKRRYISIAKELCYPKSVQDAIQNASSENEVSRIMMNARKRGR